jgi:tetratricopeptide (TPR) repeat protein
MSKRFTKEELESDVLITTYARVSIYIQQNTAKVIGVTLAILILIGSVIGYTIFNSNQQQAAQAFLGYSEQYINMGDFEAALFGTESVLGIGLVAIVNNYGRTDAGNLARFYAAVAKEELGDNGAALQYMQNFKAPRGVLGVGAISFHAVLLDNAGRHAEAAREFRRAANWDVNSGTTPQNLLRAAQSAISADDMRLAKDMIDTIMADYPGSAQATNAQRLAGMIAAR